MKSRGFCGIGIEHGKTVSNLGMLWRSADLFEVDFLFTVGARYSRQSCDTMKSHRHIPLWHFDTLADLKKSMPLESALVGVELTDSAHEIATYQHSERAIYLLGAEDHGLSREALQLVHHMIRLPGRRSMNVAVAGSIVLYDRQLKSAYHTQTVLTKVA